MGDILQEKWMKGVAVTTTILAVCASIAGSRGTGCVAKTQLLTANAGSQWAYYQAKSIKQNLMEGQRRVFEVQAIGATTPAQKDFIDKELKTYDIDIARYDKEKNQIKAGAENIEKQNHIVERQGNQFSLAVVFFQIGIMLSSVSALLQRREMWYIGLVFGSVGLFFLANGFLLFI